MEEPGLFDETPAPMSPRKRLQAERARKQIALRTHSRHSLHTSCADCGTGITIDISEPKLCGRCNSAAHERLEKLAMREYQLFTQLVQARQTFDAVFNSAMQNDRQRYEKLAQDRLRAVSDLTFAAAYDNAVARARFRGDGLARILTAEAAMWEAADQVSTELERIRRLRDIYMSIDSVEWSEPKYILDLKLHAGADLSQAHQFPPSRPMPF